MAPLSDLFSIPYELLSTACLVSGQGQHAIGPDDSSPRDASSSHGVAANAEVQAPGVGRPTCRLCGVGTALPSFASLEEQRGHFKSDWHRLNLKRSLKGRSVVTEDELEKMLERDEEVSSISGSDSSDNEDDNQPSSAGMQGSPRATFQAPDGRRFSVWKSVLVPEALVGKTVTADNLQNALRTCARHGCWVVILCRGGHFAAAVFKRVAENGSSTVDSAPKMTPVVHKTLHRYVVRAKAGGRQSSKDATGKHASSAGSSLRRYNEAALERDIQDTLRTWRAHLDNADLIFLQAPASNAKTFFSGNDPILQKGDTRVRRVPFTTHRPTFSEAKRVVSRLAVVQEVLGQREEAQSSHVEDKGDYNIPSGDAAGTPPICVSKEERVCSSEQEEEQVGLASTSDTPAGVGQKAQQSEKEFPLHAAAKCGDAGLVWKLLQSGENPEVRHLGCTAYQVASSKDVRDTFRRFKAQNPERWNYEDAGVPASLTPEMEAERRAKKAEKRARQKTRQKEKKAAEEESVAKLNAEEEVAKAVAEAAQQAARMAASRKSRKQPGKGRGQSQAQAASSEEALQRRREQMAAAAERRIAALKDSARQQQLW